MDEDGKVVDLSPRDYEVKTGKRREPFLAYGWYWGLAALLAVFAVKAFMVLMLHSQP
jgi:hypothetical protein